MHTNTGPLLRLGGLLGWLGLLVPLGLDVGGRQETLRQLSPLAFSLWLGAYLSFGLTYLWMTTGIAQWMATGDVTRRSIRLLGSLTLTLSALTVNLIFSSAGDMSMLLVLLAALLPGLLTWRLTLLWIAAQSALLGICLLHQLGMGEALYTALFMCITQSLTALLIYVVQNERRARQALGALNVQYRFTHALLQQATRDAERTRIARELHDALGHHLAVLGLELELAANLPPEQVAPSIARARILSRRLMADVRCSVTAMQAELAQWDTLLHEATQNIPGLQVHLELPPGLPSPPPAQAAALLRFVQEIVTNTVKHAQARQLWVKVEVGSDGWQISAHDDGHVAWPPLPGNGLRGLQERYAELGGQFAYAPGPRGGLQLSVHLPIHT
ncbi:hypothetical protein IHN32_01725 [Deinococcus sp. 14RED07]|uniref:sensor histidine kinase n=1 Tax=Deinococcus sp. 14RED07 TaxID=2745874 RepID=UPI001E587805|nr:histidine kinase [Deinococcus sp. 14RED07]MCD0174672.1 hypothetical protein [Deinococcus sp. 14RED07]